MLANESASTPLIDTAPTAQKSLTSGAWWPLIVLVGINILNFYDRQVPGAVAEPVRREFGLTDTQLGLLGTMFTVIYALVGLPLGRFADRGSRKILLFGGITVWAGLTGFGAIARNYAMLLVSRLGVGVGEATCAPAATSWIGDLFPPGKRAKPLALFMLAVPLGGGLSFFFTGPIMQHYGQNGWRVATVFAALPALILLPSLLTLREPVRGASERGQPVKTGSVWNLLSIPTFWWIILSGILVNFNLYALGTFLPAFFSRIHRMNLRDALNECGWVYLFGGMSGAIIAGIWGDKVARRSSNARMLSASIAALLAAPLAYYGIRPSYGEIAIAFPLITATYGLLNMYYGLVYSSLQDIVAPTERGTSMAIYFLVMYLGGASFGPLLTGRLSDMMAHRAALTAGSATITETFKAIGLHQAMLVIPVLSLGLALVLWAGSLTIGRDIERRRSAITV